MSAAESVPSRTGTETPLPHRIGAVTLIVHDLERVADFYREILGLRTLAEGAGSVRLGVQDRTLLELRHETSARRRQAGEAGLFHTAFFLPERADLGAWLSFAAGQGIRLQGASDHLVSEAVYLADPEGNGIEIYVDRARSGWEWKDGMVEMATLPLDAEGLLDVSRDRRWSGFPDGGTIGHVHLQVGEQRSAEEFFVGLLGFDVTCRYPGASFFGSGGYHHQFAGNIWSSRGAVPVEGMGTGLADVEIVVDGDLAGEIRARARGRGIEASGGAMSLEGPWGGTITVRSA